MKVRDAINSFWKPGTPRPIENAVCMAIAPYLANTNLDEAFVARLDKAIAFHWTNQNDPYSISNAVICALTEVREAYAESHGLPLLARKGPQ